MVHSSIQTLGFVAGTLTTFAFAPQVVHTWKTGGRDLSWPMLLMFGAGVSLWICYGVLLEMPPVIVANALTIVQIAVIAGIKWVKARSAAAAPDASGQVFD